MTTPHKYPWTAEQDALIRKLHGENQSTRAISEALGGVNKTTVGRRIEKLGLSKTSTKRARKWTPEMDAIIRRYIGVEDREKIAARLNTTKSAVNGRVMRLNLNVRAPYVARQWTQEEIDYLRRNVDSMSMSQMGLELDRSRSAVLRKLEALGIRPAQPTRAAPVYVAPKARKEPQVIPLTARPWLTRDGSRECKYLYGERHAYLACCQPVWMETGFCETHAALCGGYKKVAV